MLSLAMALDAMVGEARWLRLGLPHPVVIIGNAISLLERRLNTGARRRPKGIFALCLLVTCGLVLTIPFAFWEHGWIIETWVAAILIAQRSLVDHVRAVADGLRNSLKKGREEVAMIVGRDPESLDESGVARAAIESAAENFSDGVAAPIFWFAVAGLPGILIYKIVNTADSMIGHRTEKYEAFGWASARLDDLLNFVPARLTGLIFALIEPSAKAASVMMQDAPKHRSPNAGWPESAMAALLGIAV
ncbi:MAG: adenosylcobinamide-phosphate synthase CbiB, partial [Pseudomonadota bacterium]